MAEGVTTQTSSGMFQGVADYYQDMLVDATNPDVMNWPLMRSFRINAFIIMCYVIFVNYLGPRFMKHRKPYDLRWLIVPYNIALVIFNFYIFYEFFKAFWYGGAENSCTTLRLKLDPNTFRHAEITWWFFLSKYVELSDTIFFVLRKKERQLSRLHLIHHSSVPLMAWALLRSEPGGYNTFFPLANSFVHVVMYTYYGISALGDDVTIHLKFKKYVTMTQMIQFIMVLYYIFSLPFRGCNYTRLHAGSTILIAGFFFVLFCNFYWHEYLKRGKEQAELEPTTSSGMNRKRK